MTQKVGDTGNNEASMGTKRQRSGEGQEEDDEVFITENSEILRERKNSLSLFRERTNSSIAQGTSKKRKEEETEETRYIKDLEEAVQRAFDKASELTKLVKENPNTKVEIKKGIKVMESLVGTIKRKTEKASIMVTPPKPPTKITKATTCEAGTQTGIVNGEEEEREKRKKLLKTINEGRTFEEITPFLDEKWPEDLFERTKEEQGFPIKEGKERDVAILTDPNKDATGLAELVMDENPETQKIITTMLRTEVEYLSKTTNITTGKGKKIRKDKFIFLLPTQVDENGINDLEEIYNSLVKLRQMMEDTKSKTATIALVEGIDKRYCRKILEYVFRSTDVILYCQPGKRQQKRNENGFVTVRTGKKATRNCSSK